ncbi:sulfatase [Flammeovirga kamogawensis]|uniref:Sulfatase n=1 Tax=Flammeovirga kamogawensis TaxID=373891 RepID=A0ABX8H0S8_9BACT|nr:sulfatase [Flammeovirga kamogawensis]MBB6462380.1 arylsulfatase A-like enzyme [Flammeovirga kamogawensis]QWG09493.1 sulfatase [Flammeovirga kamogawensis]TRX65009.1 sulfatase [Flammeovirga kamogawensis]
MSKKSTFLFLLMFTLLSAHAQKKNVFVFVVDDLGYFDISAHGSDFYETPNIDQLVSEGVDFTNAYSSHPRCVPSRYGLQTGKAPARVGAPGKLGKDKCELSESEISIGQAFKNNGYTTFFAGKWHLGETVATWPQSRGYDSNIAGCSAGAPKSYFYPYNVPQDPKRSGNHRNIEGLEDGEKGEYLTDRLTTETVNYLKEEHTKPFFAMLCHYGVHTPLEAKSALVEKYKAKLQTLSFDGLEFELKDGETKQHQNNPIYAAMIESVDQSLGQVIKTLKAEGLYENTIIVFTSDHGGLSNRGVGNKRKIATSNLPLRAGKGHVYEGGIKVPLVFAGGISHKKNISTQVTTNLDIYPTVLDLCSLPLLPHQHRDGISIKKAITHNKIEQRTVYWHSPMSRLRSTGDTNCTVVRYGDLKLFDFFTEGRYEMYDLSKDPFETTNIYTENGKQENKLTQLINTWRKEIDAVIL